LFIIYHLTSLKALDGLAVETSEGSHAKDMFGGRFVIFFNQLFSVWKVID